MKTLGFFFFCKLDVTRRLQLTWKQDGLWKAFRSVFIHLLMEILSIPENTAAAAVCLIGLLLIPKRVSSSIFLVLSPPPPNKGLLVEKCSQSGQSLSMFSTGCWKDGKAISNWWLTGWDSHKRCTAQPFVVSVKLDLTTTWQPAEWDQLDHMLEQVGAGPTKRLKSRSFKIPKSRRDRKKNLREFHQPFQISYALFQRMAWKKIYIFLPQAFKPESIFLL